jgi:hypothetical protein
MNRDRNVREVAPQRSDHAAGHAVSSQLHRVETPLGVGDERIAVKEMRDLVRHDPANNRESALFGLGAAANKRQQPAGVNPNAVALVRVRTLQPWRQDDRRSRHSKHTGHLFGDVLQKFFGSGGKISRTQRSTPTKQEHSRGGSSRNQCQSPVITVRSPRSRSAHAR